MAKFAVGEKAIYIGPSNDVWQDVPHPISCEVVEINPECLIKNLHSCTVYRIYGDGFRTHCPDGLVYVDEKALRKLPGDSTSLPSWLTNMLKVPQGDPDKVKQPEKVK